MLSLKKKSISKAGMLHGNIVIIIHRLGIHCPFDVHVKGTDRQEKRTEVSAVSVFVFSSPSNVCTVRGWIIHTVTGCHDHRSRVCLLPLKEQTDL